jgi:5'-3' exoribonuclease 1
MDIAYRAQSLDLSLEDNWKLFDSNCITPGTEFMDMIDDHVQSYIQKKRDSDVKWQNLDVIYSGHRVPGEGEHKIMRHIRDRRSTPGYQANQRHCIFGQDGDLIMLGLATHEPHFCLLREAVNFENKSLVIKGSFQFLHLSILREYIELEFSSQQIGQSIDRERLVDDFIFMTFLVGNDFLPKIPTLDIAENGFDTIFDAYKTLQRKSLGYIVKDGKIEDYDRLQSLFRLIGSKENEILLNRQIEHDARHARMTYRKNMLDLNITKKILADQQLEQDMLLFENIDAQDVSSIHSLVEDSSSEDPEVDSSDDELVYSHTKPVIKTISSSSPEMIYKVDVNEGLNSNNLIHDYYFQKFNVRATQPQFDLLISQLTKEYLKGLMWCLEYYMKGCISWTWYFPYHYGPLLGDMKDLENIQTSISFELGKPFTPYQQLLGCLPPMSKHLLPKPYQWLMTDPNSPILEYYPLDIEIDMRDKFHAWEGIVLLPFIDESKLHAAEKQYCLEKFPSFQTAKLNSEGDVIIYRKNGSISKEKISLFQNVAFKSSLIKGTKIPFPGFPSLRYLPIKYVSLKILRQNKYQRSKKTLVLGINSAYNSEKSDYINLLGEDVHFNYPNMQLGKVIRLRHQLDNMS